MNRTLFTLACWLALAPITAQQDVSAAPSETLRPNIVLVMADDLGYGDVGYNGHPKIKTPNLDRMASSGLRFNRWYAAAPVCSPTRGSCLTGRHPYRYGIFGANKGHMPKQESTLAEILKAQGYATGHFGKWHLGTLTRLEHDANRGGPRGVAHYAPPWEQGFDVCFSTESKVPTYNPLVTPAKISGGVGGRKPGAPYGTAYWTGPETKAAENLNGDDSRLIMDRAIPFIEHAAQAKQPFFAVIWFHAPHLPVVAGPEHRRMYADEPEFAQHYYGCITALDEQVGRLRAKLQTLGVARDTMLWFSSDNGPEGGAYNGQNGSAGPFRGRKRSLFEGGVRVPGLLEWPAVITKPRTTDIPCCTADYYPTILEALGGAAPNQPKPVDGLSLMPLLRGEMTARPRPIAFQSSNQAALSDNQFKLYVLNAGKRNAEAMLFDLLADPGEQHDLAAQQPEKVRAMQRVLEQWQASCRDSLAGKDYRQVRSPSR